MAFSARVRLLAFVSAFTSLGLGCTPPTPPPPPPPPECTTDADCTGSITACQRHVCAANTCTVAQLPRGTRLDAQVAGDCQASVCGDNGVVTVANDDADVPVDGNECTTDLCTAGVPSHGFVAADTACGAGGALKCDGAGRCVTCNTAADCAQGTSCQAPACVDGACSLTNLARGTRVGTQTDGDCKATQCDGNGATETVDDNADVPVDATTCTSDTCTNGVPSNPPVTAATACSEGDGLVCNGAGACVQCVTAMDCPGFDTECNVRTCTAGVCGRRFTANDTPVASQTANDCKKVVCDGQGRVVTRNDDADLPNDNNACTVDTCTAGVPSNPNAALGASCGTALVCDGSGACVGCNTAADCPGTDSACSTRTCVANVCGRNNAPANTATPNQTPNDCRRMVCDGNGNAVNQNDDADVPLDDGNECTTQSCSNGTPTFPTRPLNSTCSQNNGSFCTAGGQCVACTAASQCPGTDTACQARTCVNNTCGLSNVQAGTVIASQTAGDCKQNQCAGDGGIVVVNLDTDVPADDGNECTSQSCDNGTPTFPLRGLNATCSQNGGAFCTATGSCVQCNTVDQCAGSTTECATRTCTSGSCGWDYVAANTPTTTQVTGDCREARCAGDGGVLSVNLDTDLPADDGNQCTSQTCSSGTPTFTAVTPGLACTPSGGGTGVCSGTSCVACINAADCPGSDTECATRTCTNNVCGVAYTQNGTALSAQTANDCRTEVCNGAGGTTSVANAADLPVDDGIECTAEVCNGTTPGHPAKPVDTSCGTNGTQFCNALAECVQCTVASQCGPDGTCFSRTCSNGVCGVSNTADGTPAGTQVAGDCLANVCDGAGNLVSRPSSTDAPSDGNECTTDACAAGSPVYTNADQGTACSQNAGRVCDGAGACVGCLSATDCPATGSECILPTCSGNTCGTQNQTAGFVLPAQTAGDCKQAECDGNGAVVQASLDADLPIDNQQCTADLCTAGVSSNPPLAAGTDCTEGGGDTCTGSGSCVVAPTIVSVSPANAATAVAVSANVVVTFSKAMNAATLTTQSAHGACTGSIQLSRDDFATCLPMTSPVLTGSGTIATVTAAPGLAFGTSYKVRVTTAAREAAGAPLRAVFTMADGFTTATDTDPPTGLVISQVYGAGGNTGAVYRNDFVELHNRGTTTISLAGHAVQYASGSGTGGWTVTALSGSIGPGQFFLIQQAAGTGGTLALPTPDVTGTIAMGGTSGKVALTNTVTALSGACPTGAQILDLVSYGSANCFEGSGPAGAGTLTNATTPQRRFDGCVDTGNNASDFAILPAMPRNTAFPANVCAAAMNERGLGELDFCNVQFPISMDVAAGAVTPVVYAQAYEAGATEGAPPAPNLQCQIGWGPANANPQWQSGWSWTNATHNASVTGNNDEWGASFTAPAAVGVYRYGARFSFDGVNWTYCDLNGAGSNGGLSFETAQLPTLTVTP